MARNLIYIQHLTYHQNPPLGTYYNDQVINSKTHLNNLGGGEPPFPPESSPGLASLEPELVFDSLSASSSSPPPSSCSPSSSWSFSMGPAARRGANSSTDSRCHEPLLPAGGGGGGLAPCCLCLLLISKRSLLFKRLAGFGSSAGASSLVAGPWGPIQ